MSFAVPFTPFLAGACALACALVFVVDGRRRRRSAAIRGLVPVWGSDSRRLARVLWVTAICLCVLAAGRPTVPGHTSSEQRGIDIVLVMDYSTSMLAADVYPSRLARMRRLADRILDSSASHRIGVVVFAGAAAYFPLTHDRQAARSMFTGLEVQHLLQGSNLGEALRVARCLSRPGMTTDPGCRGVGGRGRGGDPIDDGATRDMDDEASGAHGSARSSSLAERARAIILITDGEQTDGDARSELQLATRLGIEIYVVGVGTPRGAPVPDIDRNGRRVGWKHAPDGTRVTSRLDIGNLLELARLAGGDHRLFSIGLDGRDVSGLLPALDRLQRGALEARSVRSRRAVYERFAFPAFMLLIIQACLGARRRRMSYSIPDTR